MDALVSEQMDWYQQHGWGQERLLTAYTAILRALDNHVETLDRGNAARQTDYFAKITAIEQLVPADAFETFMAMKALADGVNRLREEHP